MELKDTMESNKNSLIGMLFGYIVTYLRRILFRVLSFGPIPDHVAFILDGNRRFARKWNLGEGMGHRAGFLSLMSLMKYCYELRIKYTTIYAFSIDNFRRKPHEVKYVMDLMMEKIEGMLKERSIVEQYGVRVLFIGNLKLLDERIRKAAEMLMKATENNKNCFLLICVAYTSTDEITHSVQECCNELGSDDVIRVNGDGNEKKNITRSVQECCDELGSDDMIRVNGGGNEKKNITRSVQECCDELGSDDVIRLNGGGNEKKNITRSEQECCDELGSDDVIRVNGGNEKKWKISNDENMEIVSKQKEETKKITNGFHYHRDIKLIDIEKHMYMGLAPDVDILVRTSGETRLSNFLSWQTWNGMLYSPEALWPEIGLRHLVWAVMNFQRAYPLFQKRKKQV